MKEKIRQKLVGALKILFSGSIIFWLIKTGKIDISKFQTIFSPFYAGLCILLVVIGLFLTACRWHILLKSQKLGPSFLKSIELTLIGVFFNFSMPGGVGGDLVKAYYVTRNHPEQRFRAGMTVLMDRVLGLYAMLMMAVVSMSLDFSHVMATTSLKSIFGLLSLMFIGFTLALALALSDWFKNSGLLGRIIKYLPKKEKMLELYDHVHDYGSSRMSLLMAIAFSFIAQICSILVLYVVSVAMGEHVPVWTFFVVAPIGFMVTAVPISPAGVGVGQAAFLFLFNLYLGRSSDIGATTVTVFQILSFLIGLIGAVLYVWDRPKSQDLVESH